MSIYLDNAATSFPKPEAVAAAVFETLTHLGGSPGRAGHALGLASDRLLFDTRELLARIFRIPESSRIAFTSGATEAVNTALFGLLRRGDTVLTTTMEHNAVTRPLKALEASGVVHQKVSADRSGFVLPSDLKAACLKFKPRLLVMSHCSNVCGTIQAVEELGPWCRSEGILFMVDAAQSAGILPLDVTDACIDLLAAPGHKGLMGPQGTGFLFAREGLELRPLLYGGTGGSSSSDLPPEQMPERLEAGTRNTPGIAGLHAGLEFLLRTGICAIRAKEEQLMKGLVDGLKGVDGIRLYGPAGTPRQSAVLSLSLAGRDPSELAFTLDHRYGIMTRAGLHCAPDAHRTLGSFPAGTLRLSPGYFNSAGDMEETVRVLSSLVTSGGGLK